MTDPLPNLSSLASACLRRMPADARSFREDASVCADELTALVEAVKQQDGAYAFDLEGRPGAIAAVRRALPVMEAELLEAVLEDVACELAAWQEALYRLVTTARGTS